MPPRIKYEHVVYCSIHSVWRRTPYIYYALAASVTVTFLKTLCDPKKSISASWASLRETPSFSCSWFRFCGDKGYHEMRRDETGRDETRWCEMRCNDVL